MENKVMKRQLPTITELYGDLDLAVKNSELQTLLNQAPKPEWIKTHPLYDNEYIPIEKIEWLLTSIFGEWWVEIREVKQILNAVQVTIRLFVNDPITGREKWQDGVGAQNMQLDKGSKATQFENLKSTAVMLAVPIAESRAISDAADKFGKIFGKDLNRKHAMKYEMTAKFNKHVENKENESIISEIKACKTIKEVQDIEEILEKNNRISAEIKEIINQQTKMF